MSTVDCVESVCYALLRKRMKKYVLPDRLESPLDKDGLADYSSAFSFSCTYLLADLLKKSKRGADNEKCTEKAISLWYEAERKCCETNIRFNSHRIKDSAAILAIREKILDVLGGEPCFDDISPLCKWGAGATYDLGRTGISASKKHTSVTSVTERCAPYLLSVFDRSWLEAQRSLYPKIEIVRGNRCVTVPKNAKTHRMIACEPTGNIFIQSGVGRYIRGRLKRYGVDLNDQTINQKLASLAQCLGLATVDLSMASDTISRSVVDFLLPPKWTSFLEDIRSPFSLLNGKWVRLEKFSSMGNGFTFELESLIFWAISSVVSSTGFASVYGDDIIIPQDSFKELAAALNFFGFRINEEKSYSSGRFFESCGKHYYDGIDVTPVYQKEVCDNLPELIRFHNRLFRWGQRNQYPDFVKDACNYIKEVAVSHNGRDLDVPAGFPGDLGFLTEGLTFSERKRYRVCVEVVKYRLATRFENAGFYAYKLRSPDSFSNVRPDGHCAIIKSASYVIQKRSFWDTQIRLGDYSTLK